MLTSIASEPALEPVTVGELKAHLRITHDADNGYLALLLTAARQQVEVFLRRALVSQTWDMWLDRFPADSVELPYPPLQSVTAITYTDEDGTEQTLSSSIYTVDADRDPGRVYLAYDQLYPDTRGIRKAVKYTYVAGYGVGVTADTDPANVPSSPNVPEAIRMAIKLLVGDLYENREAYVVGQGLTPVVVPVAQSLLWSYRAAGEMVV